MKKSCVLEVLYIRDNSIKNTIFFYIYTNIDNIFVLFIYIFGIIVNSFSLVNRQYNSGCSQKFTLDLSYDRSMLVLSKCQSFGDRIPR